jgi:hypothetical protein
MKNKIKFITLVVSGLLVLNVSTASADPTYAVLDTNGNVTNIIICGSFCSGGTVGPGGDRVVLQVAADPVTGENRGGFWNGAGTATYSQDGTFTVNRNIPITRSEIQYDENNNVVASAIATVNGSAYEFKYQDTLGDSLLNVEKEIEPKSNVGATISVTTIDGNESLTFDERKSFSEISIEVAFKNLRLLSAKINKLKELLGIWVKS